MGEPVCLTYFLGVPKLSFFLLLDYPRASLSETSEAESPRKVGDRTSSSAGTMDPTQYSDGASRGGPRGGGISFFNSKAKRATVNALKTGLEPLEM